MDYKISNKINDLPGLENSIIINKKFFTQSLFPLELWKLDRSKDSSSIINSKTPFFVISKNINIRDMAIREVEGLLDLHKSGALVPKVYGIIEENEIYQIIMEYCGDTFSGNKDIVLRDNLLNLYLNGTSVNWGEESSNFIGTLIQPNSYYSNFYEYWMDSRILPVIQEIENTAISTYWKDDLFLKIKHCVHLWNLDIYQPRRIHGDLWGGNVIFSGENSYLIDPSTSFGNPEQDLAMLTLFGSPLTDSSREYILKMIGQENGWKERVSFWLVYPLLVHVAIFGEFYLGQLKEVIQNIPE